MTGRPQSPKLKLTEHEDGVVFSVVVSAGSARSGVRGVMGDSLKVAVRAAPERGKANDELVRVLGEFLGLPAGRINVESGRTSRRKRVKAAGISTGELLSRIGETGGAK